MYSTPRRWRDVHARGRKQDASSFARSARHFWIAVDQRLCDRTFAQNHELCRQSVRIGNIELLQQFAEQRAALFLMGDRNLVRCVRGVGQLRNSVHEGATAITLLSHCPFEPVEVFKNLLGRRTIGYFDGPQPA